jgi:SAM-dependent methyltransferase
LTLPESFNFDKAHTARISEARQALLGKLLPDCVGALGLHSALDAGCGVGHFSAFLRDAGLEVTAIDGRPQNIEEARRRHPRISFHVADIEDPAVQKLGQFDFVLCFGLMYHLENPMRAFRNLHALTGKLLLVESMAIPEVEPMLYLRDEPVIEDQGLHSFAAYPSEGALWKMAYRAGFPYVARLAFLPDHEAFRPILGRTRTRSMMAAAATPLPAPHFVPVSEPGNPPDPWITDPTGIAKMSRRFGNFIRKPWQEQMAALRRRYLSGDRSRP